MNELNIYAEYFYNLELNICEIWNKVNIYNVSENNLYKSPAVKYQDLNSTRQSKEDFELNSWEDAIGFGTILGYNNLMAIDIDGCIEYNLIQFILNFLDIEDDYEWTFKSGSHSGFHIILKCIDKPSNKSSDLFGKSLVNSYYPKLVSYLPYTKYGEELIKKVGVLNYNPENIQKKLNKNFTFKTLFQKIEFMWEGFLVLPPSLHSSGLNYQFVNGIPKNKPKEIEFSKLLQLRNLITAKRYEAPDSSNSGSKKSALRKSNVYISNTDIEYIYFDLTINDSNLISNSSKNNLLKHKRVIQMAWFLVNSDFSIIRKKNFLIFPDRDSAPIDESIAKKIDLNDEILHKIGYSLKSVLESFLEDIKMVKNQIISYESLLKCEILIGKFEEVGLNYRIFNNLKKGCLKEMFLDSIEDKSFTKHLNLNTIYHHLFQKELMIKNNSIPKSLVIKLCHEKIYEKFNEDYLV